MLAPVVTDQGEPVHLVHEGADPLKPAKKALFSSVAGGPRPQPAAAQTEHGYSGHFADPDGFLWKLTS